MEPSAEALLRSERAIAEIRDRLGAELRYEHDRAAALELVARHEPQEAVADAILRMIVHQDPAASVALFTRDEAGLRLAAWRGLPGEMAASLQTDPPEADSPAVAAAASGGQVVLTPSAAQLPNLDPFRQILLAHGFRACAAWPAVCGEGQVLAILCLCLTQEGPPPDHARPLLEGAARTAAIALESRRTYTELAYQAQHDTLTSLPNRLCFHDLTRQAVGSARRRGHRLALIRIDLDNFKHINDIFGHRGGDALLREVARRLRPAVRAADSVARMGGDESAVLLHEVDGPDGAAQAACKLRAWSRSPSSTRDWRSRPPVVPASASSPITPTTPSRSSAAPTPPSIPPAPAAATASTSSRPRPAPASTSASPSSFNSAAPLSKTSSTSSISRSFPPPPAASLAWKRCCAGTR
ncbi:MAG: diguanylate cyclase [Bryobacterales bacterium]|nr:diguanylate cyclase [Bryobacterales bacterium]